jgi:hypothetical protein
MLLGHETEYAISAPGSDPGTAAMLLLQEVSRFPHLRSQGQGSLFLANGSRFYIDCSHPEIATAEADDPFQAVSCLLAGDEMLRQLAGQAPLNEHDLRVFKTNVCQFSRTTFAAHESYSYRCSPAVMPRYLLPFLASRVILAGAGGLSLGPGIEFVISPRATFLEQDIGGSSTSNRGIYHTKDEPLARAGWHRLHVLCGEGLCSHRGNALRAGTTALVVNLLDRGFRPKKPIAFAGTAVDALHVFNRDLSLRVRAVLRGGATASAVEIQREYLRFAEEHLETLPPWAPPVCGLWQETLDRLEAGPDAVATCLDWAIKYKLFLQHAQSRGFGLEEILRWNLLLHQLDPPPPKPEDRGAEIRAMLLLRPSPRKPRPAPPAALAERFNLDAGRYDKLLKLRAELCELEIRFSELSPRGLFGQLEARGLLSHRVPQVSDQSIQRAVHDPPSGGRAGLRGRLVRELASQPQRFVCDWQAIFDLQAPRKIDLSDPSVESADWAPCDRQEVTQSTHNPGFVRLEVLYQRAEAAFRASHYDQAAVLLRGDGAPLPELPPGVEESWYELLAFSEARRGEVFRAREVCRRLVGLLGRDSFAACAAVVSTLRFCGLVPHPKIEPWLEKGARILNDRRESRSLNPVNAMSFTYHWARTLTVQGDLQRARALLEPLLGNANFVMNQPRMAARARCDLADTLRRLGAHGFAREHIEQAICAHERGGFEGDLADHALAGMVKIGDATEARQALARALSIQRRLNLRMGWARSLCLAARRFPDVASNDDTVPTLLRLSRETPSLDQCRVFRRIRERWPDWVNGAPHSQIHDFFWGI